MNSSESPQALMAEQMLPEMGGPAAPSPKKKKEKKSAKQTAAEQSKVPAPAPKPDAAERAK